MKKVVKAKKSRIKKRRGGIRIVILCLLVLAAVTAAAVIFFRINSITVKGDIRYDSESIIEVSGIKPGDNIFFIDKANAEKQITEHFPYVGKVTVNRVFPDKISIEITEADEAVTAEISSGYVILDPNGRALGIVENKPNLPELIGSGITEAVEGKIPEFRDDTTLRIYKTVYEEVVKAGFETKISEIDISKRYNITFDYLAKIMVNLGNTDKLSSKLQAVLICIEDHKDSTSKAEIKFQDDSGKTMIYKQLTDDEWIELKYGE